MSDYEKIWNFENLYKAHTVARLGKRDQKEIIDFEINLSKRLTELSLELKEKTYSMSGYYFFYVHDPKERKIHALHYCDRVVQHCLCDEVLAPLFERRLIYDNAACRIGKGSRFALERVAKFMRDFYKQYKTEGYFLKCDIRKFFDTIDHQILKEKLEKVIVDKDVLWLLYLIIDSYETSPGKGIPMGNQTSQWFAIYYLDGFDRIIKEKMRIKYYSRYMDDAVLIHHNKEYLKKCKTELESYLRENCDLEFNTKTCIFPLKNGVDYLGWHFYITDTGKVVKKLRSEAKKRIKRKIKHLKFEVNHEIISRDKFAQSAGSYKAYLSYGNTYHMRAYIENMSHE